jgi:hypothetical protein
MSLRQTSCTPNTLTYPTSTPGYALTLQYGYAYGILKSVTDTSDSPNVAVWTANAANAPHGLQSSDTPLSGVRSTTRWSV